MRVHEIEILNFIYIALGALDTKTGADHVLPFLEATDYRHYEIQVRVGKNPVALVPRNVIRVTNNRISQLISFDVVYSAYLIYKELTYLSRVILSVWYTPSS